jgi:serine/threonine protein kinase
MTTRRPKSSQVVLPAELPQRPTDSFNPGRSTVLGLLWGRGGQPEPVVPISGSGEVRIANIIEPDPNQAPSTVLDGSNTQGYELLAPVGEGGFGEVLEAVQRSLGRRIAIKRLRKELLEDVQAESYVARHLVSSFRQEALTTGALEHPNIVPVYDLGVDEEGRPLMAMKFVRGRKWDEVLHRDFSAMAPGEFLARHLPVLIDVGQAVAFAHSRGVVHRDIKPSQVMLGEFGEVLLMDWGLALVFDPGRAELQGPQLALSEFTPWSPSVTSPAGTPAYMAPEQTEEAAVDVGPWTDVYLLGGCLYFLLTGLAPHDEATSEAAFRRAIEGKVVAPSRRTPERMVPPELEALCLQALEADRHKRPAAVEFIDALKDYLTGAGRKREAAALTEDASRMAREAWAEYAGYEEMSDVAGMLERALILDPDNKRAAELHQQVLLNFARSAIANSDLRLARFHAERLRPSPERERMLAEITALQQQQQRAHKSIEHLYARAAEERNAAQAARADAEALLAHFLQHLLDTMGAQGNPAVLKPLALEVLAHIDRHGDRTPGRDALKVRISCLRAAGEVLQATGNPDEALRAYGEAEELLRRFLKTDPTDEALGLDLSEVRKRIRAVHNDTQHRQRDERVVAEFESARRELLRHLDDLIEG